MGRGFSKVQPLVKYVVLKGISKSDEAGGLQRLNTSSGMCSHPIVLRCSRLSVISHSLSGGLGWLFTGAQPAPGSAACPIAFGSIFPVNVCPRPLFPLVSPRSSVVVYLPISRGGTRATDYMIAVR